MKMSADFKTLPEVPVGHLARLTNLMKDGRRKLLGLVGAPGAGKSTLALALHRAFPDVSQVVPMDGYHLANEVVAKAVFRRSGAIRRQQRCIELWT